MLAKVNVQVTFPPHNTLRQQSVRVKDSIHTNLMQTSNVVYSIPCKTCSKVYIGQGRLLDTRIKEHKGAVKHTKAEESAVAEHIIVWIDKHQMQLPFQHLNHICIHTLQLNHEKVIHHQPRSWFPSINLPDFPYFPPLYSHVTPLYFLVLFIFKLPFYIPFVSSVEFGQTAEREQHCKKWEQLD